MDPTPDALCPGCFTDAGAVNPCPQCGYDARAARAALLLPHRTLLQGQFLVGRVLGRPDGFGITCLVMEFYQGLTLAEYVERQGGRLDEDSSRQLIGPVLDGLRAVHAKGFLHRDIKPQNTYLARTQGGGVRPILLDFGATRQAVGERSQSVSVLGTPKPSSRKVLENLDSVTVNEARLDAIGAGSAQILIDWTGTTKDRKTERYRGLVPMVLRDGTWRIGSFGGLERQ